MTDAHDPFDPAEPDDDSPRRKSRMGVNKVTLIGRLTRDPEMRYTPNGTAITNLSLATNEAARPEFHDLVVWGRPGGGAAPDSRMDQAAVAAHFLTKGRLIYAEGRLQTRTYEGQDGVKRQRTEVNVRSFQMLDSAPREEGEERQQSQERAREKTAEQGLSRASADQIMDDIRRTAEAARAQAQEVDVPF